MKSMKIAECLAFAGDIGPHSLCVFKACVLYYLRTIGLYIMQFIECDPKIRKHFCALLRCFREWQRPDITDEELKAVHAKLIMVYAKLEYKMPMYWHTSTRHQVNKKHLHFVHHFVYLYTVYS